MIILRNVTDLMILKTVKTRAGLREINLIISHKLITNKL